MKTNRYLIALVAALGLFPVLLDTTIVSVALTPMRNDLNADVSTIQWVLSGYLLANAAVVAIGGYLANRFGRKRMFLLGLTVFTLGSVLAGFSPGIGWLIAFRVLQGIGGGLLLPLGPTLAFEAFRQEERARATAVMALPLLLAPVLGPIAGGWLTDTYHWHVIFFVNLPVGILAAAAALRVLPPDTPGESRSRRFDYVGLTLSTAGIIAIIYALKLVTEMNPTTMTAANPNGELYGWGYWLVWALLGTGVVLLGAFGCYALRLSQDPALDLRQFGRRDFLVSSLFTWANALITFSLLVLLPLYLQAVRQPALSPLDTGLALLPFGLGGLAGTVAAATLYRAIGPRRVVFLGAVLATLSAWLLARAIQPTATAGQLLAAAQAQALVSPVAGPEAVRWGLVVFGLSLAFVLVPAQTLALEALNGEALAQASSLFLSTRLIFASVGVAIVTTLFIDRTQSRTVALISQGLAQTNGTGSAPSDPRIAAALRTLQPQIATQAGTWAVQSIFWLIVFGSLGVIVLTLLLPGRARRPDEARAAVTAPPAATPV